MFKVWKCVSFRQSENKHMQSGTDRRRNDGESKTAAPRWRFTVNLYFYTKYKILNKWRKCSVHTGSKSPSRILKTPRFNQRLSDPTHLRCLS